MKCLFTLVFLALPFNFFPAISSLPLSGDVTSDSCQYLPGVEGFRCRKSLKCIPKEEFCDAEDNCSTDDDSVSGVPGVYDDSDETSEGCHRENGVCEKRTDGRTKKCWDDSCVKDLSNCPPAMFYCSGGTRIPMRLVCNDIKDCPEEDDEKRGCDLYKDTGCDSLNGMKHVKCEEAGEEICTLPKFLTEKTCRACDEVGSWRCNDGRCIPANKVKAGEKCDCKDCSDSDKSGMSIGKIVGIVVGILLGIVAAVAVVLFVLFVAFKVIQFCRKLFRQAAAPPDQELGNIPLAA